MPSFDLTDTPFEHIKRDLADYLRAPEKSNMCEKAQSLTFLRSIAMGVPLDVPLVQAASNISSSRVSSSPSSESIEALPIKINPKQISFGKINMEIVRERRAESEFDGETWRSPLIFKSKQ